MMRLASGTITYTQSQRKEVENVFPRFRLFAATNSLIRASDCVGDCSRLEEMDTIIYVGRLNGPKKPDLLIEGFRRARLPEYVMLKLVGDGDARATLERQILAYGLQDRVQLLGHVHNYEILKSLYQRSICAASAGYVGLGAIQAFSFGVPLVLADKEPHAPEVEACRVGENTVYFTANDADSLALALEKMWNDRHQWLSRRVGLARWTAENYSVEAMVEGFVEAIDAVCPPKIII
jgi:glycosyltransferase involved in cell wall biosynthesis